jgi:hypothetical protein
MTPVTNMSMMGTMGTMENTRRRSDASRWRSKYLNVCEFHTFLKPSNAVGSSHLVSSVFIQYAFYFVSPSAGGNHCPGSGNRRFLQQRQLRRSGLYSRLSQLFNHILTWRRSSRTPHTLSMSTRTPSSQLAASPTRPTQRSIPRHGRVKSPTHRGKMPTPKLVTL